MYVVIGFKFTLTVKSVHILFNANKSTLKLNYKLNFMKKLITSLMVLFFLVGVGTKSFGQAAGDYVFTQVTDTLWATVGNWSTSDGAGNLTVATRTPSATDNVWIPAGKRMGTVAGTTSVTGGSIAAGSSTLTLPTKTKSIAVGMAVRNKVQAGASYGFAPGTYVTAISSDSLKLTLSQPTTSTNAAVNLEFYPSCKNLNVNGFLRVSAALAAFGNVTVNTSGILTQGSDFYCPNITNFGTFNSTAGYRSCKNLYVGYFGAAPGTGDYTIINDGTFGDTAPKVPQGNTSGISVLYSNQANSLTIKTSSPSVSTYAFNVGQIVPTGYIKTLANTTLNIKQTMSLLKSSGISLSVQNNDSSENTIRTCNIDPGVTVYLGCTFHANRSVTTYPQGSFNYNVFGTLDLSSYASVNNNTTAAAAQTVNLSLCMTTIQGNAGTLTFNLGDGTQSNAGTLILGNNIQMIKQRTQTLALNIKDYSTVKVKGNYGWIMNYQLLNSNTPAPYLFPTKFYNLAVDSAKFVLPVKPIVKGIYTAPTGRAAFTNWIASVSGTTTTANSLYNSSATSPLPQGSIMFTGTSYYYVPVVRTTSSYSSGTNPITLAGDTILNYIQPAQLASGSNLSSAVTSLTSTSLQLVTAPTPTSPVTNGFVQFYAIQGTTAPTGTSANTYSPVFDGTQALIYLGGADFTKAVVSAVNSPSAASSALVYSDQKNRLVISNATAGDIADVYTVSGVKVASAKLTGDNATLSIGIGIYLVKINASVSKVIVR